MKLVIFDMDGTLIDTIHDIHSSLLCTLSYFGFEPIELSQTKSLVGQGMRQLIISAVGERNFRDEMETFFRAYYKDNMMNTTCLMEGVTDVLEHIRSSEMKCTVLSNKVKQIVDDMVNAFALDHYFTSWYGGDSFGVKKPDPKGVLGIIEQTDATPSKTIIIGDSSGDILAGSQAGAKTCFCTYGYGTLKNAEADFIAHSTTDIIRILEAF